ncbi:hypothetical protein CAPTEDRAFT_100987 [Capitella teleta]|uniref:Class II aldolase/adducin N-terminal domain-containing protein n=1 Tax=Capitella teleta TaxID=283909 RepID=R7TJS5_CAPTE|nr:hypothetical protein CAPTEDRAFT_100987 [Capitella teleta]|eukprot:ELT93964.1 hypothetical protein CAPTEDRAFT_100987 [Capitella teleta]
MTQEGAVNGVPPADGKYLEQMDPDDPEYVRQMRRPAEVKEDLEQMKDRSRVSQIIKSKAFREELEEIVHDQIKSGPHPASLLALQQISELLLPQSRGVDLVAAASSAIPISDIRGVDSLNYSKAEKLLRCKVACAYRLADIFGWTTNFNSYITTRISQDHEHFLLMPYGLLSPEVTASSLVKVNLQGDVLDPGSTTFGINRSAFGLHAAIHAARPDLKTLIHIKNSFAVAVSCMNQGLLPISQEALAVGEVSFYDYTGSVADTEETDKMTRCLGPSNRLLFLRNHGVIVGGDSIEDAFYLAKNLMTAIDIQLKTMPAGIDNIHMPSEETRKKAYEAANPPQPEKGSRKWRRGEIEFEAYMRHLDSAGYRTGHLYREPFMRRGERRDRTNSDVEIPPTATSTGQYYDDEFGYASPLKQHFDKQKKAFKSEWLNSPNAYKKEEFDETGTPHPKKITRWVPGAEGEAGTPAVKVENPNQFAPQGENPKELKEKYKAIRKEYYDDKITAGHQSKILEGMSWDEAQKIKEGHVNPSADTTIVVGAASKGIIQRDHQHNAVVYKTYYAPNPFDNMTEEEVERYKKEVEEGKHPPQEEQPASGTPSLRIGTLLWLWSSVVFT